MAFYDWNRDGKKDFQDDFIEYNIYKSSMESSNDTYDNHSSSGGSTLWIALVLIGIFLFLGWIAGSTERTCIYSGCNNRPLNESSYCSLHEKKSSDTYKSNSNSSNSSSLSSSSYSNSSQSGSKSSISNSTSKSSSTNKSSNKSSGTYKSKSSKSTDSSSKKDDPYNAKDYYDAEDFYYDNYDDFDGFEDAEDYYDEWGE